MTNPAPGWYADPSSEEQVRYWTGERWTDEVRPRLEQMPPPLPGSAFPEPQSQQPDPPSPASQPGVHFPVPPILERSSARGRGRTVVKWLSIAAVIAIPVTVKAIEYSNRNEGGYDFSSLTGSFIDYDCDDLADDAVDIGQEQQPFVQLLKVRGLEITKDARENYDLPSGTGESVILVCEGVGVWSDGTDDRVRLRATVDADGDSWVYYQAIL